MTDSVLEKKPQSRYSKLGMSTDYIH